MNESSYIIYKNVIYTWESEYAPNNDAIRNTPRNEVWNLVILTLKFF